MRKFRGTWTIVVRMSYEHSYDSRATVLRIHANIPRGNNEKTKTQKKEITKRRHAKRRKDEITKRRNAKRRNNENRHYKRRHYDGYKIAFFCMALFRLFVQQFRYFDFSRSVISSFCAALFCLFFFSRGVISSFRMALFRLFVFSRGVISLQNINGTNKPP